MVKLLQQGTISENRKPMSQASESRVPLSHERRRELKALKRGGENYNDLIGKMIEQYDPDEA